MRTVELLAARALGLCQAVRDATKAGYAYAVLDGILIPIDRLAAGRLFYSGKSAWPTRRAPIRQARPDGGYPELSHVPHLHC